MFDDLFDRIKDRLDDTKYMVIIIGVVGLLVGGGIWLVTRAQASPSGAMSFVTSTPTISDATTSTSPSVTAVRATSVVNTVTIDVKGGVKEPGVYTFTTEPTVDEVLKKAGGVTPNVKLARLNLAARMQTAQVLYIPINDEKVPVEFPLPGMTTQASVVSGSSTASGSTGDTPLMSLNTATLTDLQTLSGIGEKRAQDIIDLRDRMGGFKSVADLKEVSGIGDKTFEKIAPYVQVP